MLYKLDYTVEKRTESLSMAKEERKQRERSARIDLILSAATRVFARFGYHQASMDLIAEEAELGKSTLYYYYKSKDELLLAILSSGLLNFFDSLEQAFKAQTNSLDKIKTVIKQSALFFDKNPDYFKLYLYLNAHPNFQERIYQSLHPMLISKLKLIRQAFEQAQAEGLLRDIPLQMMISTFGSLVMGLGIFPVGPKKSDNIPEKAKWMEEIFFQGISAKKENTD